MPMDYFSQWATVSAGIRQGFVTTGEYDAYLSKITSSQITPQEYLDLSREMPDVLNVYNKNGEIIQQVYKDTRSFYGGENIGYNGGQTLAQQVNSNVASGGSSVATRTTTVKKVINVTTDAQTGKTVLSKEIKLFKDGTPTVTQGLASSCLAAVAAASAGITLGKTIDSALYNANPNFWDAHGMSTLNPETWSTITSGDDSLGATLFNLVFGINPDTGDPQAYMNENALAYITAYMVSQGVWDGTWEYDPTGFPSIYQTAHYGDTYFGPFKFPRDYTNPSYYCLTNFNDPTVKAYVYSPDGTNGMLVFFSENNDFSYDGTNYPEGTHVTGDFSSSSYTYDGKTIYYAYTGYYVSLSILASMGYGSATYSTTSESLDINITSYIMSTGNKTGGVTGINDQESATQFDPSNISDPSNILAVLTALQTQFPDLWDNRIEYSSDGQTQHVYIPVGFPTGGTGTSNQTTTSGATQTDTAPQIAEQGDNATEELVKTIIEMLTGEQSDVDTDTDTPANIPEKPSDDYNTGDGETPIIVDPTGSASALWKIYNPSQTELDDFGAWLWSPNFVDQLLKVFNDPMQAIIGLHKIYVTPSTSGSGAIKVGYLTSTATANYVDEQYVEVDCGSVNLNEFFGNVYDYDPFTKISLFLPFIGFVDLSNSDCMRGRIHIVYKVDVLTGSCLALVSVERDMYDVVKYQFAGNCAVQYPVSSGSYVGIITGLLGIGAGVAGTVLSGGTLAPMLMGAGASIGAMHANVSHSGNISSNAGAMGCKKPYILIERPQTKYADKPKIEGLPQNKYVKLSDVGGFVRVKSTEYNGFSGATSTELAMIKSLLESGVHV